MDTRRTTTKVICRSLIATNVLLALLMTLGATSALAASPTACRVQNAETGKTYAALQAAVKAAKPGSTLIVKGTCVGTTVIRKDITGLSIVGVRTERLGRPKLSGAGKLPVLQVLSEKARVRLRDLEIQRGWFAILNAGTLVLRDVAVHHNATWYMRDFVCFERGTISNQYQGTLRLAGATSVRHNSGCSAIGNEGTVIMDDTSSVRGNRPLEDAAVSGYGTVIMNDASSISRNERGVRSSGAFTMNDSSSVHDNRGTQTGGVYNSGTFTMGDASSVYGNTATWRTSLRGAAGGVYNSGTFTMNGSSSVYGNLVFDAPDAGGGLYNASGGTLVGVNCAPHTYANVFGNTPDDCYFEP